MANNIKEFLKDAYDKTLDFVGKFNDEIIVNEIKQTVKESIESFNRKNDFDVDVQVDKNTGKMHINLIPLSGEAFNDMCEYDPSLAENYEWNDELKKVMKK